MFIGSAQGLPAQQAAIATMQQLRAEGTSYDTIAKRIGEAHGFELHGRQVNRILNRETGS